MLGVAVGVEAFLSHAETLASSPLIHLIDIHDHGVGSARLLALAASPVLARVTVLDLAGWYASDDAAALIDDEQAVALASSSYVSSLIELNLRCNDLGDSGVQALAASPHLRALRHLDLLANRFGDAGLIALAASSLLGSLAHLDLAFGELSKAGSTAGWLALAMAPKLESVRWLCLVGNDLDVTVKAAFGDRLGERVVLDL